MRKIRHLPQVRRLTPGLLAWTALAGLVAGCGGAGDSAVPADAVARVATDDLFYDEFSTYVARQVGESGGALPSDVLSGLLDRFLDERLLARLAAEEGIADAEAPPSRAVESLLSSLASEDAGVTAADVESYYRDHPEEFERPDRVRINQALFDDRDTAERARRQIVGGAPFDAVAARLARDPGSAGALLQGELSREELPPLLSDVIFRLAEGEVSEIVEAEYGFHLFLVTERMPAAGLPLADARAEIRQRLEREHADRRLADVVASARRRYNVTVFERNLPFNYQGRYVPHSA